MSGTTAISVVITGTKVYVANVGDSRAIVARRENGKLVARPLSIDQTPFRLDERERVKKSGARVMTLDQLEGLAPLHEVRNILSKCYNCESMRCLRIGD